MNIVVLYFVFGLLFSGQTLNRDAASAKGDTAMNINISSTAFNEGEMIPKKYTCDGENVSPSLEWTGIPKGTKSLALICDDPDAPRGTWVHWVLFNIPADASGLTENVSPRSTLKNGARHGINDSRKLGYDGPCPPGGTHRYFFKVYALAVELSLESGATKAQLLKAMEGHILGEGQLMGKYKR
jgi:Raf kinase inhibitor-like YbhB/YbcL family protein